MKNYIFIVLFLIVLSCSSSKMDARKHKNPDFKIVETSLIGEKDTIVVNELRFYNIRSARDGMKMMYRNYGQWDKKIRGKHQQNINRVIWSDVKLLDDIEDRFTVIADGTETTTDYFACLIIFDSKGNDCFTEDHPYKERLTESLTSQMNGLDTDSFEYRLFD